eukprot:1268888-Pleurochrysis_carterae.AAC.1
MMLLGVKVAQHCEHTGKRSRSPPTVARRPLVRPAPRSAARHRAWPQDRLRCCFSTHSNTHRSPQGGARAGRVRPSSSRERVTPQPFCRMSPPAA